MTLFSFIFISAIGLKFYFAPKNLNYFTWRGFSLRLYYLGMFVWKVSPELFIFCHIYILGD